jgi:hypothetical protein
MRSGILIWVFIGWFLTIALTNNRKNRGVSKRVWKREKLYEVRGDI